MALLRTKRLGTAYLTADGQSSTMYVCPVGQRAVLRCLVLSYIGSASGAVATVGLLPSGASSSIWIVRQPLSANSAYVWTGIVVLNAGDALNINTSSAITGCVASGAELPTG